MSSSSSMSQAFAWIRSRGSPEERVRMREAVWCWALGAPRSPCGTGNHGVQAKALKELLHLPLRPEENVHLVHFLSHPPRKISTPSLSLLHDLVTLRLVHQGQYAESLQLDRELAGSGGKEEDRQRRREQVREFIAILPEAQRRALLVESEAAASRKDQERGKVANGYIEPPPEDLEMGGSWIEVDESKDAESDRQMAAPTPIRPSSALLNIAQGVPLPASPAPPAPLPKARRDSPFSGPPRFARSPVPSSTTARVLSGSPFLLPKNAAASGSQKLIPKPPRQIINDDDNPVDQSLKRSTRGRSRPTPVSREQDAEMEDDGDEKEPPKPEETPASRRPNRRVTSHTSRAPPKEPTPPPSPPSTRTRRRQSTAPPPAPPTMPGAFTPESEPVLEDEEAPPAPRRASLAGSGSRSRPTRNASKAALDDEPGPTPSAKRTKSNTGTRARRARSSMTASEVTDDGPVSVRTSTRRGGTAQPSERGSPTPSVMSSVAGRSDTGRRRRVRGSQTPRMTTRSKKG